MTRAIRPRRSPRAGGGFLAPAFPKKKRVSSEKYTFPN